MKKNLLLLKIFLQVSLKQHNKPPGKYIYICASTHVFLYICVHFSAVLTAHGQIFQIIGMEMKQLVCLDHLLGTSSTLFSKCLYHTFPSNLKCIKKRAMFFYQGNTPPVYKHNLKSYIDKSV